MSNDFLPFAVGSSANVLSQSAYAALTSILQNGFQSGIAQSVQLNKVWRQSSIMSAVLAQFISDRTGQNAVDDGTTATLLANLKLAAAAVNGDSTQQFQVAPATASNQAVALSQLDGYTSFISLPGSSTLTASQCGSLISAPASTQTLPALSTLARNGQAITIRASSATGPATVLTSGTDVISIAGTSVTTYSIPSGYEAKFTRQSSTTWTVDGTSLANNLPLPVAPATASNQAMQLGQAVGRLVTVRTFTTSGTYAPTAGTNSIWVKLVGGGGGGGGSVTTSSGQVSIAGGGGGGAYAESRLTSGFSGAAITIGAGGSAGAAGGGNGGNGGTTSFGSLSASGGGGGIGGPSAAPPYAQVSGSGGLLPTTGNVMNASGQPGGTSTAAALTSFVSGSGGSSLLGFGAAPNGALTSAGAAANSYGGGGSGGSSGASTSGQLGGAGFQGVVIVYEYS
jgi:hypothetical protein